MSFSAPQLRALKRPLDARFVRTRERDGREFNYIEGWHAIAEANRIFGFDGWDRETTDSRCVMTREMHGRFVAVYIAKVRITVRTEAGLVVRDGHGTGEGRGASPGEAHDMGLKTAETDATKRALATFGRPFGLSLYKRCPDGPQTIEGKRRAEEPKPDAASQQGGIVSEGPPRNAGSQEISRRQTSDEGRHSSPTHAPSSKAIDKSVLPIGMARRYRDKAHLRFVASQPCLLCGRAPSDAHHLRFAQPQAMGMKVSDEFTVPLCRTHHRQLHNSGNEAAWWADLDIDAIEIAKGLWEESRSVAPRMAQGGKR